MVENQQEWTWTDEASVRAGLFRRVRTTARGRAKFRSDRKIRLRVVDLQQLC